MAVRWNYVVQSRSSDYIPKDCSIQAVWTLMGKQARVPASVPHFSFLQSPQEIHDMESCMTQKIIYFPGCGEEGWFS